LTASQPPLRVAVLGLGFMGSTHLKALGRIAGARLAAVFDTDERRLSGDLSTIQGNFGEGGSVLDFAQVAKYRDLDALLADPAIDAVDVCLPTDLHADAAMAALRACKHVLVEKPMALDGATAERIAAEAERVGRTLMTAHVLRFWPEYAALREAVRGGEWGRLLFADFRRRCAAPGWSGWQGNAARSGGGILDLLIHDVDMCLHLLGMPHSVAATGYCDQSGMDWVDAHLVWPRGETAHVGGGWLHQGPFPFSMEFLATFEGAALEFSSAGRPLMLYPKGGAPEPRPVAEADAYCAEIEYFVECCREGLPPEICPPRESAAAVRLVELIVESRNRKGERIACML
jgi:predicted dehydrogenase